MNIGNILKEYRLRNNFTQDDVSSVTGLASRYISQIERGYAKGGIDTLIKFCNAYNVTPNDILQSFLSDSLQKYITINNDDIKRLSKRDQSIINTLTKYLLNN